MLFERFEDPDLSHYSYAVGCPATGKIAIVDPKRDVDTYLEFAKAQDLEITHIFETHIHADYASGALELAAASGAQLWLSAYDDGEVFDAAYPHNALADSDSVTLGGVRIEARHTPGHTPEHMSFLIFDTHRSNNVPLLMLTGDFLFVGSLGRPDLLGEGAKLALAEKLYESVTATLTQLPDSLEIHPAHGSGSLCGAGMGGRAMSTLGFERIANPYLDKTLTKDAFIEQILGTVPPFPPYYKRMKRLNADGAPLLNGLPDAPPLGVEEVKRLLENDAVVIDLRDQLGFGGGHIPGSLGIGVGGKVATWASWVVPYDRPLVLVVDHPGDVEGALRALIRVGLDGVCGYLDGGIKAWREAGCALQMLPQITPKALFQRRKTDPMLHLLDVRSDAEWAEGRISGAQHLFAGTLAQNADQLPAKDRPIAITCSTGYRSTVAASVLQRLGFTQLINVTGGMTAWTRAGLPVETGRKTPAS